MDYTKDELRRIINRQKRIISKYQKVLSELTRMNGVGYDCPASGSLTYLDPGTMTFTSNSENAVSELAAKLSNLGYDVTIKEVQGGLHRFELTIKF